MCATLLLAIIFSNFMPLSFFCRIVLVFLPLITIILWFELWLGAWGKAWILSATLLIVSSQIYPNYRSVPLLLAQVLFLLGGIMSLYVSKKTQERLLHQAHSNAIRVLLRQSPTLIQTVDYTGEATIILDNRGSIIQTNAQSALLLSLPESFLIGKTISKVLGILPDFQPTNIPEDGEFTWETQYKEIKHLKFRTRSLFLFDIPSGTLLTLYDITEAKKRAETYVQVAKFSIISKVSAGLAHEIRNPLTTIKGFMQLITPEQWPESFRPYRDLILEEIQSIDQMLNKFVLITSPTAPQIKPLNLTECIKTMAQTIQPICYIQGVTLILELLDHSVFVMGDDEQLFHALLSIMNNALEASPKVENIIIRLTEHESQVRISVIDNGPGIPENLRQRVLEPFFTTQKEGTGLGLTIAQQIILAHHGKLHFSTPPFGTEVLIDLPCLSDFTNILSA